MHCYFSKTHLLVHDSKMKLLFQFIQLVILVKDKSYNVFRMHVSRIFGFQIGNINFRKNAYATLFKQLGSILYQETTRGLMLRGCPDLDVSCIKIDVFSRILLKRNEAMFVWTIVQLIPVEFYGCYHILHIMIFSPWQQYPFTSQESFGTVEWNCILVEFVDGYSK